MEQADYYRQALDDDLAMRWERAVDEVVQSLLVMPNRGTPCRFKSPTLAGVRSVLVPGFSKPIVFYRHLQQKSAILIVQVLHGARNLDLILSEDDPPLSQAL